MDRNERLLRLIILLRRSRAPLTREDLFAAHPGYGAAEVKLDSILRTFERDKAGLREMGLPLEVARDDHGDEIGYRLPAGKAPAMRCSKAERLLLAAAADSLASVPGMPLRAAALNALAKLVEQPVAEEVARRSDAQLERIVDALERGRSLAFKYLARKAARSRKVELDDALLELRGSFWYLTGFDRSRGSDRSFRLDRIQGGLKSIASGDGKRSQPPWSRWHLLLDEPVVAELERGELAGPLPSGLMLVETGETTVKVRTRNRLALLRWLCAAPGWRLCAPEDLLKELQSRLGALQV